MIARTGAAALTSLNLGALKLAPRAAKRCLEAARVENGYALPLPFPPSPMKSLLCLAPLALLACACAPVADRASASVPVLAIVGATVVHPSRDGAAAAERDATVVVEGARIASVGPARTTAVPPGARVIDGRGKWVIPGLIDAHVHFF